MIIMIHQISSLDRTLTFDYLEISTGWYLHKQFQQHSQPICSFFFSFLFIFLILQFQIDSIRMIWATGGDQEYETTRQSIFTNRFTPLSLSGLHGLGCVLRTGNPTGSSDLLSFQINQDRSGSHHSPHSWKHLGWSQQVMNRGPTMKDEGEEFPI